MEDTWPWRTLEGMRTVVVLALMSLVALVIAVITGSAWPALAAVASAAAGIVVLVRDWRTARDGESSDAGADQI